MYNLRTKALMRRIKFLKLEYFLLKDIDFVLMYSCANLFQLLV